MVGIMLLCMGGFVLSVLEGIDMESCVGSFDGNVDDVGNHCVGLGVGGIMSASEIDDIQLNYS